jgi:hypothetical protein
MEMRNDDFITALEFCSSHQIELSFLNELDESGLIELEQIDETTYIRESQLQDLEKMVRLHFDLDINIEGLGTIVYLLQRFEKLQEEIKELKNRLSLYEDV